MSRLRKIKPIPLIAIGKTKLECIGSSSDGCTNRWLLTCPHCGQQNHPTTTMMAENTHNCSSCARLIICNYRAGIETASLRGAG